MIGYYKMKDQGLKDAGFETASKLLPIFCLHFRVQKIVSYQLDATLDYVGEGYKVAEWSKALGNL